MEFLLNEKSLCGQFDSIDSFLDSVKPLVKCIELIHQSDDILISKTTNFYECNITKNKRLCELKSCELTDELVRFKNCLDREIYEKPQWDSEPLHDITQDFRFNGENVAATSLAEAAIKQGALLSFFMEIFIDTELEICNKSNIYKVQSIYTPQYLLKNYNKCLNIDRKSLLEIIYQDTRIDCSTIEEKYGADILEKYEFDSLISTFNKFVEHESWESIALDDGLEYKKYTPKEKKKNWFLGRRYSGKTIMKFRFSGSMRCFGYRKDNRFKVLRLERTHSISDNG